MLRRPTGPRESLAYRVLVDQPLGEDSAQVYAGADPDERHHERGGGPDLPAQPPADVAPDQGAHAGKGFSHRTLPETSLTASLQGRWSGERGNPKSWLKDAGRRFRTDPRNRVRRFDMRFSAARMALDYTQIYRKLIGEGARTPERVIGRMGNGAGEAMQVGLSASVS